MSGLLSVVMDYVASQAQKSKTSEVDNPADLQHVFIVLKMMAHGNSKVQNRCGLLDKIQTSVNDTVCSLKS